GMRAGGIRGVDPSESARAFGLRQPRSVLSAGRQSVGRRRLLRRSARARSLVGRRQRRPPPGARGAVLTVKRSAERGPFRPALAAGFVARVDVTMKIGNLEESITVTGGSPVIDVTTTTTSVTLNSETLNEIPRGRDLSMVYSMAPGVTLAGTPDVGGSNMANRQNISAGGVALQPKLQIEGMNIVLSDDQNSGVYFNSDTLEEIQIKTAGNDASVGVPGISMVAVITSGGNDSHGLYRVSDQTPALQSNNLDAHLRSQGLTAVQPVKTFYDYQADLGGKIVEDQLWFYGAYSKQQKN